MILALLTAWATPQADWDKARETDDPKQAAQWLMSARQGFEDAHQPANAGRVVLDQIRLSPDTAEALWRQVPDLPELAAETEALKGDLAWATGDAPTAREHWTQELRHLAPGPRRDERQRLLAWRHLADRPSGDVEALASAMMVLDLPDPKALAHSLRPDEEIWVVQRHANVPNWLGFISPHRTWWVRWDGTPDGAFAKLPNSSYVTTRHRLGDALDLPANVLAVDLAEPNDLLNRPPPPPPSSPWGWFVGLGLLGLLFTGLCVWTLRKRT